MQNIKFTDKFYLTVKDLAKKTETTVSKLKSLPTNFIFIVDVSGSMSYDLDLIRKQLKNKLPSLVNEGDTLTMVWFSGRNDSGILMEEVEIKSLTNLQTINAAIDRFLKPIGLTAFHKPLVLASEAIKRIKKNRPNGLFSLIFLTDGFNNDCSWSDVTKSLKELEADLSASTFVEYGYYADSRKIAEMAELVGGEKVEAQRFDDYEVVFENKIQKTYSSSKKIIVDLPNTNAFDFAFTVSDDNEIILYSANNNQVMIPENTQSILFFSTKPNSTDIINYNEADKGLNKLIYTSLYVLTDKLKNEYVDHVFKVLGDTNLYNVFSNAYGKEKLMNFKAMVKECVVDESKRFYLGRSTNLVADENAYCVMNLVDDLTKDENALLYTGHPDFSYKRIGAKKINKAGILTDEEKNMIASAGTIDEAQKLMESIAATKEPELKFQGTNKDSGSPISNLVWSSERANLSIGVRYTGTVDLPINKFGLTKFDTFIFRNYTIIKDGILNINRLPVSISENTFNTLKTNKLIDASLIYEANKIYTIDFSHLPTVNKSMVKNISAKKLGEKEYELVKLKALEKAYKYYEELHFPRESKGFVEMYGKEAEEWLKGLGITEFNGFAPKVVSEKGNDFYMAPELATKIAKHSAIPKITDVIKKITDSKPLNEVDQLVKVAIDDYNSQINSALYTSLKDETLKNNILKNWLSNAKMSVRKRRRELLQQIAEIKFSLILSKKWFEEFASFDDNTLEITIDKKKLSVKFEMAEKEINI